MWADKSNPKLRRCQQRISPFVFFFYLSLFLSVFCSSTSTFFPCRHLFFFPRHDRAFTHAHLHPSPAYTRRRACVHAARPRGASSNLFLLSLGFFSSYFFPSLTLRGDQNERLRIEGILRTWIQNLQLSRSSGGDLSAAAHDGTVGTRR